MKRQDWLPASSGKEAEAQTAMLKVGGGLGRGWVFMCVL